jgi:predicted outer membrane repeat protein
MTTSPALCLQRSSSLELTFNGNVGTNGGAICSIGVSWTIINSLFSYNRAIGYGANPADLEHPAAIAEEQYTTTETR